MILRPGSLAWLLSHDVLLNWRRFTDMFARLSRPAALVAAIGTIVVAHALAWPIAAWLGPLHQLAGAKPAGGAFGLICLLAWMTSQGLLGGARALVDRGHLDLLLASPLPTHTVLVSRALAIAASGFGSVGILALPVAHVGAFLHGPGWLAVYPILAASALLGAAAGLGIAIGLCLGLGARRARHVSQLAAAAIGGGFILVVQIGALIPGDTYGIVSAWMDGLQVDLPGRVCAILRLPLDVLSGDMAAALVLLAASAVVFAASVAALRWPFVRAALEAAGGGMDGRVGRASGPSMRFRTGVATAIRRKEWRLLRRDPTVFAQLSLQIIYTVPVAIILMRNGDGLPVAFALAPAIVVIAAQIAASLAWLTVSGEDAPELIAAAPVPRATIERAKLSAIAAPVVAILGLPMLALAIISPRVAIVALLAATGGAVSTSLLNFWHPMPGNRRGMLRRHSQSKLIGMIEHLLALLWAIGAVLAMLGTWWAIAPVLIALVLLMAFCPSRLRLAVLIDRTRTTVSISGTPLKP